MGSLSIESPEGKTQETTPDVSNLPPLLTEADLMAQEPRIRAMLEKNIGLVAQGRERAQQLDRLNAKLNPLTASQQLDRMMGRQPTRTTAHQMGI